MHAQQQRDVLREFPATGGAQWQDLSAQKNRRVLVIDDNRAIHEDFRKILSPVADISAQLEAAEKALFGECEESVEPIRFEVDSAYQGEEGALLVKKSIAEGRPYAMAFVDVRMPPGWDGIETTQNIWEIDPHVQIVICTAYSDYTWEEIFKKLGQRDSLLILKKPFDSIEALQLAQALTEKWWLHRQSLSKVGELEGMVAERTQEVASSLSMLNATFESAADGIVAVDLSGKVLSFNSRFATTWQFPAEMLARADAAEMRAHTASQVVDPERFLQRVAELEANPEAESFDVVELKDGHTFERYVFPRRIGGKCVGTVISWRDITERKSGEDRLRRAEELYRQTIVSAGAVPYSYDYATRTYQFIGEGIEELTGYNAHEISPGLWKEIIQESVMLGPASGLKKEEAARRVIDNKMREWRCDMRILMRNGKSRWVSDTSVQTVDSSGNFIGSMGILQDITERKHAEVATMAFSKLGQDLSSSTSPEEAAGIICKVADDLMGWDAACVQLYSEKDDLIHSIFNADIINGKRSASNPIESRTPTEMNRQVLNSGAKLILREKPTCISPQSVGFGDKSRPSVSLMFVPIRHRSSVVGIISIQSYLANAYDEKDLNTLQTLANQCGGALERIWTDEALRKSESQFRGVWNTSADGMRLANRNGIVLIANDAYCRMIEKSKNEIEGHPISVIQAAERGRHIVERHGQHFDAATFLPHLEKEITLWNGKKVWFELSNSLIETQGQPSLMLSIFRDITERKRMEEQLFQSQKMETVGKLAGGVAHEFNSILTAIIGQSELLREDLPAGSPLQENATEISKAAERAAALTRQLLAYGRKQFLQPETLDLNRVLAEMDGMLRHLMGNGVETQLVRAADLEPVRADVGQIEQVILNMAMNARDAMPKGGKFILETANVTLDKQSISQYSELKAGRYVLLTIRDTGVGIGEKLKPRIFEPFFTTKDVGQGTGLGLSTCYGIVKQSGGHISFDSEVGRGTTFKIYLPQLPSEIKPPRENTFISRGRFCSV